MLTCFMNLTPALEGEERPRALYQGLAAVAHDTAGRPPRFPVRPLPRRGAGCGDAQALVPPVCRGARCRRRRALYRLGRAGRWRRRRGRTCCLPPSPTTAISTLAIRSILPIRRWRRWTPPTGTTPALVLTSLVRGYAMADRMEESNEWRHPIDLVAMLEAAFEKLPALWAARQGAGTGAAFAGGDNAAPISLETLLGDDPQATIDALLAALEGGHAAEAIAQTVAYAAALRIARFHTSNEFGDWDTALHTFTFANAVHQGLRRAPSLELLRGVFDAAMSIYLDRFLNMPAAHPRTRGRRRAGCQPGRTGRPAGPPAAGERGRAAGGQLPGERRPTRNGCWRRLAGCCCARTVTFTRSRRWKRLCVSTARPADTVQRTHFLVAAIRYLAAHAPTVRSQGQTYQIAVRLHRGEALFEGSRRTRTHRGGRCR